LQFQKKSIVPDYTKVLIKWLVEYREVKEHGIRKKRGEFMNSFRSIFSYRSVSESSSSGRSTPSASNRSTSSRNISLREVSDDKKLSIEVQPTNVKISRAILAIQRKAATNDSSAFWEIHHATISEEGRLLTFKLSNKELQDRADCKHILRGLAVQKNPLPNLYHNVFTVKGELSNLIVAGNNCTVNASELEYCHGNGDTILEDYFSLDERRKK
jgi:hypothetical protein